MNGIDATFQTLPMHTGRRIPASTFSIPKSSLRADGAPQGGRDVPATLASPADRVELSGYLPVAGYAPPSETAPPAPGAAGPASGKETGRGQSLGLGGDEEEESSVSGGVGKGEGDAGEEQAAGEATDSRGQPLDDDEQREVESLKTRDREVRQHEQAHKSAGGQYAGAISYDYQQGPDGRRYAVGGEVSIDVSPEKDPSATIAKMRQVRAAALAPAEPSSQDQAVAAEASRREAEARQELSRERTEKAGESGTAPESGDADSEAKASGEKGAGSSGAFVEPAAPKSSPASNNSAAPSSVAPVSRAGAGGGYARLNSRREASAAPGRASRLVDVYA